MKIFITGLSYDVNDADLTTLFKEFGAVTSAKVIIDRMTSKSKGYGFVEMVNNAEAKQAIAELNGAEYDGKIISVSEARPREERPSRPSNNRGGYGSGRGNRY